MACITTHSYNAKYHEAVTNDVNQDNPNEWYEVVWAALCGVRMTTDYEIYNDGSSPNCKRCLAQPIQPHTTHSDYLG